jgi:hypothetical protein
MERVITTPIDKKNKNKKGDNNEENEPKVLSKDRLYLRLKNDRTIKLYTQKTRPIIEWRKKISLKRMGTKKLFETEEEVVSGDDVKVASRYDENEANKEEVS